MRLYLDDDSVDTLLIRLLTQARHDVQTPANVGLIGMDDSIHLTHAAADGRVLLSYNHDDFRNLHNLIAQTGGDHPGILIVRRENNPQRDMSVRAVARAMERLVAANIPIPNQFIILNHWR
jgi:hypothetical protein